MNKKILIKGKTVHDVGYRPFLLEKAQELCIPNYYAKNIKENGIEIVEVSLGGEDDQLAEFIEFINNNHPPKAVVSEVKECPNPPERIMPIDSYVHLLHTGQLGKIAQTGLGMLEKQDQTIEILGGLGGKIDNLRTETNENFNDLKTETRILRTETNENFQHLDVKYGVLAQNMNKIFIELIKERQEFKKSMQAERKESNKNIEKLVKAIIQSKR